MNGGAIVTLNFIDENDMEEAKERLKHAQEHGIDREVWHVYDSNTSTYPNYDRGFFDWISMQKREFKSSSESAQDYISRLVRSGQNIEFKGNLYVVQGSLGLDFKLKNEGIDTRSFFIPLHKMPYLNEGLKLPVAEELGEKGINLPSSTNLTKEQIEKISEAISSFI